MAATSTTTTSTRQSYTETAYDWYQRSNRRHRDNTQQNDPTSAAWAFASSQSGISFIDAATRRNNTTQLPVLQLHGTVGKTWTLLSLAARFVAATQCNDGPRVIVLDSTYQMTTSKLAHVVRSTLLRQQQDIHTTEQQEEILQQSLENCLRRIHLCAGHNNDGWIPLLEALRHALLDKDAAPTLVLWDSFGICMDEVLQQEVLRQLVRLHKECQVFFVFTTTQPHSVLDRMVTHKIRLARQQQQFDSLSQPGHEHVAILQGQHFYFSITASGILT